MDTSLIQDQQGVSLKQWESFNFKDEKDIVKRKKDNQGRHECEVLGPGPETAESAYAWRNCSKNPGHANFIPAPALNLKHLPPAYRTQENLIFIKAFVDVTVRLRVTYTSEKRPTGYPFSGLSGSRLPHYGSGWVRGVYRHHGPCPCKVCADSSSPCQDWYEVRVVTACHVVYNTDEAQSTAVEFFYDDEESLHGGRAKTLMGLKVSRKCEEDDFCQLDCATHDKNLFGWHEKVAERISSLLYGAVTRPTTPKHASCDEFVAVIISHPHGQPKHITVGSMAQLSSRQWNKVLRYNFQSGYGLHRCEYNIDTCPGTSGAPVFMLGPDTARSLLVPHSGFDKQLNINYSATRFIEFYDGPVYSKAMRLFRNKMKKSERDMSSIREKKTMSRPQAKASLPL